MAAKASNEVTWSLVADSGPFAQIHVDELYRLARRVDELLVGVTSRWELPQDGASFCRIDHDFNEQILRVLQYAGRIRALLDGGGRSFSGWKKRLLHDRISWLLDLLGEEVDVQPILDAAARNSVEHFDEYVDDMAVAYVNGSADAPALYPCDFVLSSRNMLDRLAQGVTYPLRCYFIDEAVFSNCGKELRLRPVHEACTGIRRVLERRFPGMEEQFAGGMMYVTSPREDG